MNAERFEAAREAAGAREHGGGVGTLGEKTLHLCLKYYFEPDAARHEVRVGSYVADIAAADGIYEIQTRQLFRLRKKLASFLEYGAVTVVYPVAAVKWVVWVDPVTGEAVGRRRSPKSGTPADVLAELYGIREFLLHPGLRVRIPLLEVEDYRLLDGWSADRKRGATKYDRFPVALLGEAAVTSPGDWAALVPDGLPQPFLVKDFAKACRMAPSHAGAALRVLCTVGAAECVGKSGNAKLYRT